MTNSGGSRARLNREIAAALLAASAVVTAAPVSAITRSCGADAVANTTNVLCAAPSGPCDGTTVRLTENIEILDGSCEFDLGGRAFSVERTLDMNGDGTVRVRNAGNVTITSTGRLRARGDLVQPQGFMIQGGTIEVEADGAITHSGTIDVIGDPAGTVELHAGGDVVIATSGEIRVNGQSSFSGEDGRYADGGAVEVESTGGSVRVDGVITCNGQSNAAGGTVTLRAARNLDVNRAIEANGGEDGGGSIDLSAGDHITLTQRLNVESLTGGGDGGDINIAAGEDTLGGVVPGGKLTVTGGPFRMVGSEVLGVTGSGGNFTARSDGTITLGTDAAIRTHASSQSGGTGGSVLLESGGGADLTVNGVIVASGGSGGDVEAVAGRNLTLAGDVDTNGKLAGSVSALARGTLALTKNATANGVGTTGRGGNVRLDGCALSIGSAANAEATGSSAGGLVALVGRDDLAISSTSHVKATGPLGAIRLETALVGGTCSNDPTIVCDTNPDCTVGCNTGQCLDYNPDTGGTMSQFTPSPVVIEDPALACQ